jgi:hypothetical protein
MRGLTLIIAMVSWVLPVSAAETYTIPISVVPGSVTVEVTGEPDVSVGMPFSIPVQASTPNCALGGGQFSAEVVNGGLEVEFEGSAVSTGAGACQFIARAKMELELDSPELGGTGTMVRLEAIPETDFSLISSARAEFVSRLGTSSSVAGSFKTDRFLSYRTWVEGGESTTGDFTELEAWIPGDTVRFPVEVSDQMSGNPGQPTQGTIRVRYVFKVTVPEPSASLSLPLGMAWLAGLSKMRGGA